MNTVTSYTSPCVFARFSMRSGPVLETPTQGLSRGQPMQINAADTNESFELTRSTGRDAEADLLDTQVRGVHVLEAIEQRDELRDPPV